jgi:hypothetical protein
LAARAYLECILRAPAKLEIRSRYSISLDKIPRNEILSVWVTSISQKYSRYRIMSLTSMRFTYWVYFNSDTVSRQQWCPSPSSNKPHNTTPFSLDGHQESASILFLMANIPSTQRYTLPIANISHQESVSPSRWPISAIGRVYHPFDGQYRPLREYLHPPGGQYQPLGECITLSMANIGHGEGAAPS